MRSQLNSDNEDGWFGALGLFFINNPDVESVTLEDDKNIQFDRDDVFPDNTNINASISGIAWMVKHGHAKTSASTLEIPLISIHSLANDVPIPASNQA